MKPVTIFLIAGIAASASYTSNVYAQEAGPEKVGLVTMSRTVNYSDLDLSKPAGADVAISRIRHAAQFVCGGVPDAVDLERRPAFEACVAQSAGTAVAAINAPLVTARFANPDHFAVVAAK